MIVKKFEEQVIKNPEKIALKTESTELTYSLLNSYANRVGKEIIAKYDETLTSSKEQTAALLFEHGTDMIVGTIGALKANKIYVPFDPSYPIKRLLYMLENSEASLIVTNSKNLDLAEQLVGEIKRSISVLNIDEIEYANFSENICREVNQDKIAYILYTSGSTGTPKGVAQTHKNVLHFIKSYATTLSITQIDKMTLFSAFSHDAAVMDIYGALLNGATLYPLNIKEKTNIQELVRFLNNEEITIWHSVPTVYRYFINILKGEEDFPELRFIVLGGESVLEHDVIMFKKLFKQSKLVNLYGQSESSYNSSQIISSDCEFKKIILGEPVDEIEILVLDENGEEVLPLREGEIVILSDYLALGYWKDEEKTKMAFQNDKELGRWYKTGDLGRVLEDGNIEFVGRKDFQIKIRGFRVEPGEIESQLLNYNTIKEAVVLSREDAKGDKCLCAYIVASKELKLEDLREYLCVELPTYMVPTYFVQIEEIPVTSTGKIDRKALLELQSTISSKVEYEAARNEIEEKLVIIWRDILGLETIGINDSFFALGGHSLKATMLLGKIHKEFNVLVPLREIFISPTIKEISNYIGKTEKNIYSSIEIAEGKEYYEASSAQKRMYMLQQFDLKSTGYNMTGAIVVEGSLDVERLEKSFAELVRRHETLRTSFETIEEKIVQRVNQNVNFKLECLEVSSIENQEKAVDNIVKDFAKVFDLNKAPLLRVGLIKLEEEKHVLVYDMHHIISDGESMGVLINEFAKIYEGNELEQLRIQYKDYSQWQNNLLKSDVMQEQKEYWINRFKDEIPVLNIRTDFQRPLMQSFEGENVSFKLDKELTKNLKRISKETGSTMYMVLLSGINILLSKYSGQEDIIVGSPIAGRPHADLLKIIGMFVNTLVMRNHPDGSKTYEDFLKEIKENALKAYENQDYQFDELIDKLSIPRDISRNPLFDVLFTMQNLDSEDIELKDLTFKRYKQEHKVAKFDLTFSASEVEEEVIFDLQYSTKLYKRETIERMVEHFVNVIKAITGDVNIKLSEIEMITVEEKHKLLYEFNDTYVDYPRDKTIHELFEEQVEKTPGNIAIVVDDEKLTYRELNEKANKLARTLRERGVKADSVIGIMVERSIDMIVGIMAILKSGGAYLPIDAEYPEDRIKYMLEGSKTKILITQRILLNRVDANVTVLDIEDESVYGEKGYNLENVNTSKDLAYVIYTSGSTGNPKGVMVEHGSLINLCKWHNENYEITECDKVAKYSGAGFDASVWEMFPYIIEGASIHIIKDELRLNIEKLNKYYEDKGITIGFLPTAIFEQFIELENKSVKKLLTGADKLKHFKNKPYEIYNNYGPTEYTVVSTSYKVNKYCKNIPIGKPISNTKVLVLDRNNKIMPIGIAGELCISGDGLARGYLNNETLTLEKFTDNPYEVGQKMYKTGDLVTWLSDGNLEFLGRIDHQVKIRGYRIELGEIENNLLQLEGVKESIVIDREDEGRNKYLCAYLVSEKELTVGELRKHLSKKLPEYMIPSYFVKLEKMPLTPNGKIDRKALPMPGGDIVTGGVYEAPKNETEKKLVQIWQEVLHLEMVGVTDNFFELGGHSLKATVLASKIHKELNVEVPLREIFKSQTISGISEYIENTVVNRYEAIELVNKQEYYEASSAQKRMYMLQQFDLESTSYNMPGVMLVEGTLDIAKVERVFIELIKRHETLRTSFMLVEGKVVQRVNDEINFNIQYEEGSKKTINNIVKDFIKPFDLSNAPLLRVGVAVLEEEYILMYDMHHIISDGVSMGILVDEFTKLYEDIQLQELKIQYKDFSEWQNKLLKSEEMNMQQQYWIDQFSHEIPVLNMRTDYSRPLVQSFEGSNISYKLDRAITGELKRIAKETGSTMYMVLLSGVNILLSKYSGQEDIIVGSPIAGRPHADLENVIGMFVNTLAMRNRPEGNKTYEEFLVEVKENSLKAYENQDYQFDELVDKLNLSRDMSRNPLFDVMFIMQNMDLGESTLKELKFKKCEQETNVAKFDLTFSASEVEDEILFNLDYSTKLYKRETIEILIEHFKNIFKIVASHKDIMLKEIDMLIPEEKHKLLYDFNNTYADYNRNKTLHQFFEEAVQKTPNNIAVVYGDKRVTYMELNVKANKLAVTLREKGVKVDTIVAIMAERSLEMIIGVMAIIKAGGAYLPIVPEYPQDRIRYILDDSKTNILLTQSKYMSKVDFNGETINLEDENIYSSKIDNLENINSSRDLAYIIYTSGSTGKPKGVMVEHQSAVNILTNMQTEYPITEKDVYLLKTTYSFDVSVTELFGWFLGNGSLAILPEGEEKNIEDILNAIDKYKVTHINFVPSMMNILLDEIGDEEHIKLNSLKFVFVAGEAFPRELIRKCAKGLKGVKVENIYGPTETTIYVTRYSIESFKADLAVPIGKPMYNVKAYIVDKYNELVPIGVAGELCIGGECVTRGYLNKVELTQERFIENSLINGERIYKTGDLARWLPNGNIEFLGRIDHQVKIRGFRIELGEIESQLLTHEAIKEAIVIDKQDNNGIKYLCSYVVADKQLTVGEIREYLLKNLPEYMIPSYFIQINKMPLTTTGKLDRKALPEPEGNVVTGTEYEAPRSKLEATLVTIWTEILGIEKVGVKDNFFELGGHSLKASMLVNLMYKEFDVKVSIKDIFLLKTIEGIANYIKNLQKGNYIGIEKVEDAEYYPVSAAQKRMFVINQLEGKNTTYNLPMFFRVQGKVDKERLEGAFKKIVQRHEILRTSFEIINNESVQRIHADYDFEVNFMSVREEALVDVTREFIKPFNLGELPLLRVNLAEIESENYMVMIDMHHIITDGVSIEVMLQEIVSLYEGYELEEINMQYKDFAVWQNKLLSSDLILKQEKYWLDMFNGEIPVLSLQTDYERPLNQTFEGNKVDFYMDKDFTKKLNNLAQSTETTLFMILFSAYNIMLSKLASQEDIIVGLPAAARQHVDVQKMLGMFVNTLAIRSYPKADKTFDEFLQEIKTITLESMENQDYQFEMLLGNLKLQKDLSRNPLFDVFFAFENVQVHNSKLKDLRELKNFKISSYAFENNISKFDFILFTHMVDEGLYFQLEYNTSLFKRETIEQMSKYLLNITEEILNNPHKKLREIEMLCTDERYKILFDFNDTNMDYNNDYTIHEQFEIQVAKTPNNIAIIFEDMTFTYKEVNEKANKLARVLRKKGVDKEDVVGIMIDKSPDMIISILAILKAGAAYLPIDHSYPKDRILYMLNDSKAKVLLTKSESIKGIPFTALMNLDIKDNDIVLTKPREYIKNFDLIPMPNRELIDVSKYKGKIGMASVTDCIALQTTRGCPYQCIFCHKVWSKNHTFRSAENIYNEMEYYYKRGVNSFAILDDCFNLNIENGKRLFRMILKNKLKLKIFFPNGLRGDILTKEYIDLMVAAGVVNINLSLETASPRLQKLVKKHLDLDKFKNVMDYIATEHPNVILELATMHGFPTETEEEAMMTLNFVKDIKWIHFPYIHILKVFPNTEMEALALAHGVDKEAIKRSVNLAYHEIPDTLPFHKSFTRAYQAEFFNDYFLSKERIKKVLPVQMKILSEDALLQKYNAYLPTEITKISDLLELAGIDDFRIPEIRLGYNEAASCVETSYSIFDKKKEYTMPSNKSAKKMLFLDLSQHFSLESMLYKVAEQPIGQLYLLTYLKERFKDDIDGRIFKSGIDFDSYDELKVLIDEYKPDFIGIRTLSFYKEFFHETVSLLRQWGINVPIITGGPYGTSEYKNILKDDNVDLVILGEGEYTTGELIENMLKNNFKIPHEDVLKDIKGIAYRKSSNLTNENSRRIIVLDNMDELLASEEEENLNTITNSENLAYVMYTSGSTGKPKGIMVENRQVNNCINWMQQEFKLTEKNKVVQRTNLTFDPSVWEIFWPLYKGASIKLLTTEKSKDAEYLIELMTENKDLTIMYCPASLVTGMTYLLKTKENTKLRLRLPYLVIGAEPISAEVVKDFYLNFEGTIVNTYGPTECTINNTYSYLDKSNIPSIIPIGKPVANNQIYILSKNLELLPINVLGEIYIAGDSVARGYIYNEEKTNEVFVKNPFGSGKLYKTGDLGRILPDGNIEIMGRTDNQVKIRGYRMELQEIEVALQKNKKVKECVVIVKSTEDAKEKITSCKQCGISSNYPDTHINDDGVCNVCENASVYEKPIQDYFKNPEDLDGILTQDRNHESKYDCLLLYSGGKASAYALYQLVNKGYRILVATYDNGYFSKADMDRIKDITKKLSVDHVILNHENTNEILKESLKSASTVCKGCFFTSSALAGDYAMKNGIRFVIGATLSRGQIIENKLIKLINQGIVDTTEIEKELSKVQRLTYDMNENIYNIINVDSINDGTVYDKVKYLDFYRYFDVKNEEMLSYLNSRDGYWTTRKNYAIYSTNCSIKQVGDYCHLEDKGYHYYGSATSWEKRLNHISIGNVKEDLKCFVGGKALENLSRRINYKRDKNKQIESKYLCAYVVPNGEVQVSEIRDELFKILPSHMVPSYFVTLDEMPLTKEGKVDRKALPEPQGELKLGTEYACTRNELEEKLAVAWSEILGVDRVGIKDNFFELGGDSIKAIQVSANLQKYDLKMEIKDLFKYPTIEMLSEHVKQIKKVISQETVEGSVLLTPIQKWLFEQKFEDKHHFNQAVMIYSEIGFDEAIVRAVFNKIVEHHDALRMVYKIEDHNITQFNRGIMGELISLTTMNLIGDVDADDKIEKEASRLQLSIDLENGPLVKLGLFKTDKGDHLLIIIHHLVVDGVSWRIIFEEFSIAYEQAIKNNEIKLQDKTNSFKEWSEELQKYADGKEMLKEKSYWDALSQHSIVDLPKDKCIGENCRGMLDITLTEEETKRLLNKVNQAYNTEINDVLLTALGITIKEWTGESKVLIELEGHGREEIINDMNITRTIGWFTSMYPVVLDMTSGEELSHIIKATKENLRGIPNKGIGYGILRYLTAESSESSVVSNLKSEIRFNYLGQFDNDINTNTFTISNLSAGQTISPKLQEQHTLEVSGMIIERKLTMNFAYNANEYDESTIYNLINNYKKTLQGIIEHCTNKQETELTPSDFENEDITIEEFEDILDFYNNI